MTSSTPTASRQDIVARRRGHASDPSRPAGPEPDASDTADATTSRASWKLDAVGILVVCALVVVAYFPVIFLGKTLSTAALQPGTQGCGSRTGACVPYPDDDQRVDPLASAVALEPWGHVDHRVLSERDVPLWNPYQGIGAPLAGNMQSAPFDPVMLAYHLHPTQLVEDITFIVALLLTGIAAYVAARVIGLRWIAATVAGGAYVLSGWFFVYGNNQWIHTYLYLPLIVATVEWTLRTRRLLPVLLLGLSITGMVLAGMPEPMFMALCASALYAAVRLFVGPRERTRPRAALTLAAGGAIGLLLAAPVVLLFAQYLPQSFNIHSDLAHEPPRTVPVGQILNLLMPRIATTDRGATRNWTGVAAVLLAAVAIASPRSMRRYVGWPFVAMGALVAIQSFGGDLVAWTRHIPFWSQGFWPIFGTPVISFAVAVLAGIGVQAVADRDVGPVRFLAAIAVACGLAAVLVLHARSGLNLDQNVFVLGGWPLAVGVVVAVVLAALFLGGRVAAPLLAVIVLAEVMLLAPGDVYATRQDPYPSRSWIEYVSDNVGGDGARVVSSDSLLFPNTASVYGLSDIRMLDALYPDRWWKYLRTFVSHGIVDRFTAEPWVEGAPNFAGNRMLDVLGVKYALYRDGGGAPPEWSGDQYRLVFHGDGVRVYQNTHAVPRPFVVHDVHTVRGERAALDFWKQGESKRFPDGAVQVEDKDPTRTAVVETEGAPPVDGADCAPGATSSATTVERSSTSVTMQVEAASAGLLVLTDQYYPGWTATVNGASSKIYATDVAFRGVVVPKGTSTVVLRYEPEPFRLGIALAGGTVVVVGVTAVVVFVVRRRRRSRGRDAGSDPTGPEPGPSAGGLATGVTR